MLLRQFIFPVISFVLLSACGGGSSEGNGTYPDSYLQFYNGSANSATTTLTLTYSDDIEFIQGNSYLLVAEKDSLFFVFPLN